MSQDFDDLCKRSDAVVEEFNQSRICVKDMNKLKVPTQLWIVTMMKRLLIPIGTL